MAEATALFLTLEGAEGAGKSTLARRLAQALRGAGHAVLLTYEPGGTDLGEQVRRILKHGAEAADPATAATPANRRLVPRAETLLFCAARAQLVEQAILPHLQAGGVVVCDRYADSTLAYQGFGRGLPLGPLREVLAFATAGVRPDLTVLLDLDVREGLRRKAKELGGEAGPQDRFESEAAEFHERVRRGYLALAAAEPARWLVVDAARPPDEVAAVVWEEVTRRLETKARGVGR